MRVLALLATIAAAQDCLLTLQVDGVTRSIDARATIETLRSFARGAVLRGAGCGDDESCILDVLAGAAAAARMACPRADADAAAGVDVPPGFKPRIFDVLTGAPGLEPLFEVPDMPLYMAAAAPGTAARDDSKAALRFWWSPATGGVQVHPLAPLEEVYARQHMAPIGSLWPKHHAAFADFITRRRPRHVLEVGGGPGDLAKQLAGRAVERWTLVDPRATCPELEGLDIVRAFFDDVDEGVFEPVDAVVHSHLFEHLYDPRAFLGRVARLLKPGGRMLFSARGRAPDARRAPSGRAHQVPNMTGALETSTQPSLHWEHTWLVHEAYVRWLLADFGFEVRDTLAFGGAHSVFYDAESSSGAKRPK